MKRVYKRREEPALLAEYRRKYPEETWEHFRRRCRDGYRQVKRQILEDQHGLCAYCEISIKEADSAEQADDFRVEHFHPKADSCVHNYHLDWNNLLGVCHGGSRPDVAEAEQRYSMYGRDRSCDVPKGSKELSEKILNPMRIPGRVRLFSYVEHTGKILVDRKTCPASLRIKAENTIRELNLNAPRLMRLRKAVIDKLDEEVAVFIGEGTELSNALDILAERLVPDYEGNHLAFFSVIRWYLGNAAERIISSSGSRL